MSVGATLIFVADCYLQKRNGSQYFWMFFCYFFFVRIILSCSYYDWIYAIVKCCFIASFMLVLSLAYFFFLYKETRMFNSITTAGILLYLYGSRREPVCVQQSQTFHKKKSHCMSTGTGIMFYMVFFKVGQKSWQTRSTVLC